MNSFLRWWKTLDRPERIVAMSLSAGTLVAIVNSATWAVAVSYMSHQKAKVAIAGYQADTLATDASAAATDASAAATNSTYSSSAEPLPQGADAFDR